MNSSTNSPAEMPARKVPLTINEGCEHLIIEELNQMLPSIQGDNGNGRLFHAACVLREREVPSDQAVKLLSDHFNPRCIPPWDERDIVRVVNSAYRSELTVARRWPKLNEKHRGQILEKPYKLEELIKASPQKNPQSLSQRSVLERIYTQNSLICAGATVHSFMTEALTFWTREGQKLLQFIVPNPMKARRGYTQDGILSPRSLQNVGPRKFVVVEFDLAEKNPAGIDTADAEFLRRNYAKGLSLDDINSTLIVHLMGKAPLTLAVHSGGKSIHAWFHCEGQNMQEWEAFFAYAVSIGADSHLWTLCAPSRMPGGIRDNGNRQEILFFNPQTLEGK